MRLKNALLSNEHSQKWLGQILTLGPFEIKAHILPITLC